MWAIRKKTRLEIYGIRESERPYILVPPCIVSASCGVTIRRIALVEERLAGEVEKQFVTPHLH